MACTCKGLDLVLINDYSLPRTTNRDGKTLYGWCLQFGPAVSSQLADDILDKTFKVKEGQSEELRLFHLSNRAEIFHIKNSNNKKPKMVNKSSIY